jgi:hypothetical protein
MQSPTTNQEYQRLPDVDAVIFAAYRTCTMPFVVQGLRQLYTLRKLLFVADDESFCPALTILDAHSSCVSRDDVAPGVTMPALRNISREGFATSFQHRHLKNARLSDRTGWYLQQFNKFLVATHINGLSERYLVWDGDIIPLRPWQWTRPDGRDGICHKPSVKETQNAHIYTRLTGEEDSLQLGSFVCGVGLFRRKIVRELMHHMNDYHGGTFPFNVYRVSMQHAPKEYFSEFQAYGLWLHRHHPHLVHRISRGAWTRNPPSLMMGGCCPSDRLLQIEKDKNGANLIFEEHKVRSDGLCKKPLHESLPPEARTFNTTFATLPETLRYSSSQVSKTGSKQATGAWVYLCMGNEHIEPLVTSIASLHAVGTAYPVVVLTSHLSSTAANSLHAMAVHVLPVVEVSCPHSVTRRDARHKYMQYACSKIPNLLNMTMYDTVIYLDSDTMALQNMDHSSRSLTVVVLLASPPSPWSQPQ